MKRMLGCFALISLLCAIKPAQSAPINYAGNLELRSPVWASRSFDPDIRNLDLKGNIRFTTKDCPVAFWVSGEHSFSYGYFVHENKMKLGLDFLVSKDTPLTFFSYWERRFDSDVDRIFVGARLGFHGQLD